MIYSEDKLEKVTMLKVNYDIDVNSFTVRSGKNEYFLMENPKTKQLSCTCWWFANRTIPNIKKYGMCSHVLAVWFNHDKKKFDKELMIRENE